MLVRMLAWKGNLGIKAAPNAVTRGQSLDVLFKPKPVLSPQILAPFLKRCHHENVLGR